MISDRLVIKGRRGMGIVIALVVILMVCLLVGGVAQLFLSGQVYGQAARGAGGMAAEYLAESAIQDVVNQLNRDLNDPAKPVFREVRMALLTRKPQTIDLSRRYHLELLTEAIESSEDAKFHGLFDIKQPRITLRVVPEHEGGEPQLVEIEATARLAAGRQTVTRTVRVFHQIGITLVAPVRPLDQVPFAIVQTPFLEDFQKVAEEVVNSVKAYNRTGELLEGWKSTVEGKPLGVALTATLPPLSVGPEQASQAITAQLLADEQYFYRGLWDELEEAEILKLLPPPGSVIFARAKEEVDLKDFQYYTRLKELEPLIEKLRKAREKFPPVMQPLEEAAARGPLASSRHSEWSGKMGELGKEILEILKPLQEGILEITKHLNKHTAPGITADVVARERHWDSKLAIWPLAQHISGGKLFDELLEEWPAVSGHLAIYPGPMKPGDPAQAPALCTVAREHFKGQAIVSCEGGDLAVGRVHLERPTDRLVIEADTIQITGGPTQAALVSRKNLVTEEDAKVDGSIIIKMYPRPKDNETEKPWHGKVKYDERLASGTIGTGNSLEKVKLDHYVVSISPRVSFKDVKWQ